MRNPFRRRVASVDFRNATPPSAVGPGVAHYDMRTGQQVQTNAPQSAQQPRAAPQAQNGVRQPYFQGPQAPAIGRDGRYVGNPTAAPQEVIPPAAPAPQAPPQAPPAAPPQPVAPQAPLYAAFVSPADADRLIQLYPHQVARAQQVRPDLVRVDLIVQNPNQVAPQAWTTYVQFIGNIRSAENRVDDASAQIALEDWIRETGTPILHDAIRNAQTYELEAQRTRIDNQFLPGRLMTQAITAQLAALEERLVDFNQRARDTLTARNVLDQYGNYLPPAVPQLALPPAREVEFTPRYQAENSGDEEPEMPQPRAPPVPVEGQPLRHGIRVMDGSLPPGHPDALSPPPAYSPAPRMYPFQRDEKDRELGRPPREPYASSPVGPASRAPPVLEAPPMPVAPSRYAPGRGPTESLRGTLEYDDSEDAVSAFSSTAERRPPRREEGISFEDLTPPAISGHPERGRRE